MSLQLKTRIQNVNILNNNIEIEKNILKTMLFILAALAIFYVLILGNMVFSIIERRALEKEMLSLSNEVGKLEIDYLAVTGSVDINLSSTMGFKEIKATFATRKPIGYLGNIKLTNNEI